MMTRYTSSLFLSFLFIPFLLAPWAALSAPWPVLDDAPCNSALEQIKERTAKGESSGKGLWISAIEVPKDIRNAEYPISFVTVVRGISKNGRCITLKLSPVLRTKSGDSPVDLGDFEPWTHSFEAYVALDKPRKPEDIKTISVLGHQIGEKPLSSLPRPFLGGPLSDMAIQAVITLTDGNTLYFGGARRDISGPPSKTAALRYWLPGPAGKVQPSLVLCNTTCDQQLAGKKVEDIKGDPKKQEKEEKKEDTKGKPKDYSSESSLTYVFKESDKKSLPDEQASALADKLSIDCQRATTDPMSLKTLRSRPPKELVNELIKRCIRLDGTDYLLNGDPSLDGNILSIPIKAPSVPLSEVEVTLHLAKHGGDIPLACKPSLQYWPPKGAPVTLDLEAVPGSPLKIKATPKIKDLDARGKLVPVITEGDCEISGEPNESKDLTIRDLRQKDTNKISILRDVYVTRPTLHVVFAFDAQTFERIIPTDDISRLAQWMIKGLQKGVDSGDYYQVALYSRFEESDDVPVPDTVLVPRTFSESSKIESLATGAVEPLKRGSRARELSAGRIKLFLDAVDRLSPAGPNVDPRALFVFVGRRDATGMAVCKGEGGDKELLKLDKALSDRGARAVIIDFYNARDPIVQAGADAFPRLELLDGQESNPLRLYRCIDRGDKADATPTRSTDGNLIQVVVNWDEKVATKWLQGAQDQMEWLVKRYLDPKAAQ